VVHKEEPLLFFE